jgi:hypothetical protein
MRTVQSRVGINLGELWYCSPDCLAAAASVRFTEMAGSNLLEMRPAPRLSLGLMLLSKGYLDDKQLRLATRESQLHGEDLGIVLVRLGLVNERQLTAARAAQWGYPVLSQEQMGSVAELDIPPTLLRSSSAAPIHSSTIAKRVMLGFVYRVNHSLLSSVEQMTGFRAEPCFITPTDCDNQNRRFSALPRCEEVVFDTLSTPAQMGRTIGGLAVEIGARDIRFSQCGDYAWTRLVGRRRTLDVLLRFRSRRNFEQEKTPVAENIRSAG